MSILSLIALDMSDTLSGLDFSSHLYTRRLKMSRLGHTAQHGGPRNEIPIVAWDLGNKGPCCEENIPNDRTLPEFDIPSWGIRSVEGCQECISKFAAPSPITTKATPPVSVADGDNASIGVSCFFFVSASRRRLRLVAGNEVCQGWDVMLIDRHVIPTSRCFRHYRMVRWQLEKMIRKCGVCAAFDFPNLHSRDSNMLIREGW